MSYNPNTKNVAAYSYEPTGFPNLTDTTLTFNDGYMTLTVSPVSSFFDYYVQGVKYRHLSQATATITDTEGMWYFYFDGYTLQSSQTFSTDIITKYAYVANVYWDSTNNSSVILGEERHGLTMDGATHLYLHSGIGAKFINGFALGNFQVDGTGNSNADGYFSVANGIFHDEDIRHTIVGGSPQILATVANLPIFYRTGSDGYWRKKDADSFPVMQSGAGGYTGASGRLGYNQWTGSAWQRTEVPNNNFVLTHVMATNDVRHPIVVILGIDEYATKADARTAAKTELASIGGLPFQETIALGSVIYETSNSFANAIKARVVSTDTGDNYVDLRQTSSLPANQTGDHGNLSGLSDPDHPATAVYTSTTAFNGVLSTANTTVQSALDTIDNLSIGQISPLTTKGDLLTRNASTHVRLAVGPDGYVLTADSADGYGIKWAQSTGTGSGTPAGSDGYIQFNDNGVFGATGNLVWDGTTLIADEYGFLTRDTQYATAYDAGASPGYVYADVYSTQAANSYSSVYAQSWGTSSETFASLVAYTPGATSSDAGINRAGSAQLYMYGDPGAVTAIHSFYSSALAITSLGVEGIRLSNTAVVVNEQSNDLDFRVESNAHTHALFLDAGVGDGYGRLGVGTSSPSAKIDIDNVTSEIPILIARDDGTAVFTIDDDGYVVIAPKARTSGIRSSLVITAPAHTSQTASQEIIDVNLNLARTVEHATGALSAQRAIVIQPPTYSFVGASTITTAATVAITGAPVAGTNATITNSYALYVQDGATRLNGQLFMADGSGPSPAITFLGDTDTGMFLVGTNNLGFAAAGQQKMNLDATRLEMNSTAVIYSSTGSATGPSYAFSSDVNSGMYSVADDVVGIATGSTLRWQFSSTSLKAAVPFLAASGSAAAPAYAFDAGVGANTGMYYENTGPVVFLSSGGAQKAAFGASEVVINDPGSDLDFRVEGDGYVNLLHVDAGTDRIGVRTSNPFTPLHVNSAAPNASPIMTLSNTDGYSQFYRTNSNPQSTISGSRGDIVIDSADGYAFIKQSGIANSTGWANIPVLGQLSSISWASTTDLNLDPSLPAYRTLTLIGSTIFTSSNRGAGRGLTLRIVCDGTTRTLTWPVGWSWLGSAEPTSLAAGDTAILSIMAFGTTDADMVASWAYENTPVAVTGDGYGVAGRVAYWSSPSALTSESGFFWNAADDRLGIGTSAPVESLDIKPPLNDASIGVQGPAGQYGFLYVSGNADALTYVQLLSGNAGEADITLAPGTGQPARILHNGNVTTDLQIDGVAAAATVFNSSNINTNHIFKGLVDTSLLTLDADGYTRGTVGVGVAVGSHFAKLHVSNTTQTADILRLDDNTTNVWRFKDGGDLEMIMDNDIINRTDGYGDIGTDSNRWGSGHFRTLLSEYRVLPKISTHTIDGYNSRTVFTNESATALVTFNLPVATAGLSYTFVVIDADGITVNAVGDDTIRLVGSVSEAAGYITSTTIGSTVTLVAISGAQWVGIAINGTWGVF